ncbi:MAG: HD family phosphohydrolase [Clostridium sp.]
MRRFLNTEIVLKDKSKKILIYTLTFFISFIILATALAPKQFDLQIGEIARADIKAPRDTVDEIATREKEQEAMEKVDEQYTLKGDVKKQAEDNLNEFFTKVSSVNTTITDEAQRLIELKKYYVNILGENDYKALIALSDEKLKEVQWNVVAVIDEVYSEKIEDGKLEKLSEVKYDALAKIESWKLENQVQEAIKKIVIQEIKPNFYLDKEKTEEKIKEAQKSVSKIIIKKNQIIVNEGEPITEKQLKILKDLGMLDDSKNNAGLFVYIGLGVLIALIIYLQHIYLANNYKEISDDVKKILLISILNVVALILTRAISIISPFLVPFACVPILLTLLFNHRISIVVSCFNLVLISALVEFSPQVILIAIINITLASTILRNMQQRNDILYSSLYIAVVNVIATFTIGVLISNNTKEILIFSAFSGIGVLFAAILSIGILPFLEVTFDIVTTLKLLELSNPNHPLLKKLLMEAPGTYHHSMLVANIAEMAAEEVGANPVLARIGAYYHDIGKTKRPYFFGENQLARDNPHDKISPNLSTLIITSHVKDGLELADEYKLPDVVRNIIGEHHGTTLVKYFYYTLKNASDNPEEVKEEDFMYPGPTPSSKEAGIIMLSDSVEAAVRSISEPTKGKIEEMVNNIVKDKLYSGQLDNCDLTLKDLEKIRKCFLKALFGIYHQRVEYPTEKKGNKLIEGEGV